MFDRSKAQVGDLLKFRDWNGEIYYGIVTFVIPRDRFYFASTKYTEEMYIRMDGPWLDDWISVATVEEYMLSVMKGRA